MAEQVLILATTRGVVVCRRPGGGWMPSHTGLSGKNVTSIIAREGVILAGTTEGVFRSTDLGQSWEEASHGLDVKHVRWMAYHPDISDREFAGTEPAGIFYSLNGGDHWQACPEVLEMRRAYGWSLPYSPEAGCVRGLAFHAQRAYAAVEDGCVLVSEDGGMAWKLAPGSKGKADHWPEPGWVQSDVHSVEAHPSSPDLAFAPTGGGLYRSTDAGASWECLYRCYTRAAWIDPSDPKHILFGPADSVDYNGRIEASMDGGRTWEPASTGLETPWRRHMVERFFHIGDELLAVLSNGELMSSPLAGLTWQYILAEVQGIQAVTWMPDLPASNIMIES